jgi:hypothetical protein
MKDKEVVQMIVVKREDNKTCTLHVSPQDDLLTGFKTELLIQAILNDWKKDLPLTSTDYDLYIKIPSDKVLKNLNLDSLESVLLLPSVSPTDFDLGAIYKRGSGS